MTLTSLSPSSHFLNIPHGPSIESFLKLSYQLSPSIGYKTDFWLVSGKYILKYLGGFVTSYIIFRNAEISANYFLKGQTFVKEDEECFGIFQNTIFFNMGSSKLIN